MLTCAKGASHGELLIEAARRNNTDLLQEVINEVGNAEKAAVLLNETKTVLGNYLYHEAALRGNCMYSLLSPTMISKLHVQVSCLHLLLDQAQAPKTLQASS